MTRTLLLVAGCGLVACLVSFAIVLALGPVNWSDWNWEMGDHHGRRGPPVMGDGPTVTRELTWPGNTELHINVPATVTYTQGPVAKVTVTGPQGTVDHLYFDDENLRFDRRVRQPGHIEIVMTAPDVSEFVLAGSQRLTINGFDHDTLEVRLAGSSDVKATGRARHVEAHIAGSGDVDLGAVEADSGEVHIAGSGKTVLAPKQRVEIHIAGSGDVILRTNPADVEQHIAGSGRIVHEAAPAAPAPAEAKPAETKPEAKAAA
jgi:hypothetical protein